MKTLFLLICLTFSSLGFAQKSTTVTIKIDNMSSDKGKLVLGMYQKDTFLKAAPDFGKIVGIKNGKATVVLTDVPAGTYAISCFHDENGNNLLDRDPQGIPTENYGLSKNPEKGGYPQFDNAKFTVGSKPLALHIKM